MTILRGMPTISKKHTFNLGLTQDIARVLTDAVQDPKKLRVYLDFLTALEACYDLSRLWTGDECHE